MTIRDVILGALFLFGAFGLFNALGRDLIKTVLIIIASVAVGLLASWLIDGGVTVNKIINIVEGVK